MNAYARDFGLSVVDVLSSAAVAAWRDGHQAVTSGHLLASITRRSAMFRYWKGSHRKALRRMRWEEETPGSFPEHTGSSQLLMVSEVLREAHWWARREVKKSWEIAGPVWSEQVWSAMRGSLEAADSATSTVSPVPVLAALLTGEPNQAQRCLHQRRINLSDALASGGIPDQLSVESPRNAPAVFRTALTGLTASNVPVPVRKVHRGILRTVWGLGPLSCVIGVEARRQVVRTGSGAGGLLHVLAAILELECQLLRQQVAWRPEYARDNRAGEMLLRWSLRRESITRHVWGDRSLSEAAVVATPRWSRRWDPPMGVDAMSVLRRAEELAVSEGRAFAGTVHILKILLDESTGSVPAFLTNHGINIARFRNELG